MKRLNATLHFASRGGLTARYALLQALNWAAFCGVFTYSAFFLLELGFSNTQAGLIIACANVLGVLLQPLAAHLATRCVRTGLAKLLAAFTATAGASGGLLWLLHGSHWASAVTLVLLAAVMHGMQGLVNSLGMEYINAGHAVDFGLARGIGSGGYAVSSAVLGALTARFGPGVLPKAHVLLYACMTALLLAMPYAAGEPAHGPQKRRGGLLRRCPRFSACLAGCVLLFFGYNLAVTFMIQIVTARGGTSAAMGGVLGVGAFLELPAMGLFSVLLRRYSAGGLLRFSAVFLTVKAVVLLCTTGLGGVWAAQLLQPLAYALVVPASVYYTNRALAPPDRVLGQALMAATSTLASVFGSALGGLLLDAWGVHALLAVGAAVSGLGTTLVVVSARHEGELAP